MAWEGRRWIPSRDAAAQRNGRCRRGDTGGSRGRGRAARVVGVTAACAPRACRNQTASAGRPAVVDVSTRLDLDPPVRKKKDGGLLRLPAGVRRHELNAGTSAHALAPPAGVAAVTPGLYCGPRVALSWCHVGGLVSERVWISSELASPR